MSPITEKRVGQRPLTLIEKIIAANAVGLKSIDDVRPGNTVVLGVSWILSSEAGWVGMDKTYTQLGRPSVFRKDRVWLAQDHTVDPRIYSRPKVKATIELAESAAKEMGIVDYYGPNYTIMHTEFCRERAQPGQVVVGSDSHTCSAGSLGALAIGLGAADVAIPMVTGETWLNIPPILCIKFINKPAFGIGGKDTILYVLGQLKRNTVALGRAVEFVGPGLKYLSSDARFAISNMTTEFGGIAGVFVPDEITAAYIARRQEPKHREQAIYYRPDEGAAYAETFIIDLAKVNSLIALYPSPDNVVDIDAVLGKDLDGCFIGACTTAEEDLILGALVLRQGLQAGLIPVASGTRKVTPGSVPIVKRLRKLHLLQWYEKAGFAVGSPGCSYCVGVAADVAGEGEVWLSSQNRNFPNRMGPGSFANLASAATVAASSFSMKITDPRELLDLIDKAEYRELCQLWTDKLKPVEYVEPNLRTISVESENPGTQTKSQSEVLETVQQYNIKGKAILFGDNIDTDAIIPAQSLIQDTEEELAKHCFKHVRPDFLESVKSGLNILVAGKSFGCGSSRQEAAGAIKAAGIKAVIARSYSFIYSRNQPNLALLGFVISDSAFYEGLTEGTPLSVDLARKVVRREDSEKEFPFQLSAIEEALVSGGGVGEVYKKAGAQLFRKLLAKASAAAEAGCGNEAGCGSQAESLKSKAKLAW